MVKDWSVYMQYIDSLYHKNQTSEGRIACIADYVYILQKTAQQRVQLTAFAVGSLCFFAGVIIGKILEAG